MNEEFEYLKHLADYWENVVYSNGIFPHNKTFFDYKDARRLGADIKLLLATLESLVERVNLLEARS